MGSSIEFFFIVLAAFVKDVPVLTSASRHRLKIEYLRHLDEGIFKLNLAIFSSAVFVIFIKVIISLPFCCNSLKREILLQEKLWNRFADRFIDKGASILFSGRKEKYPSEYLIGVIKEQHPEMPAEDSEVLAVSYIKDYVKEIYFKLADDFKSLPEAPFTRHSVKKGKLCICQHLEQVIKNQIIA